MSTPMKLIAEHSEHGIYVYREDEKHHAIVEPLRAARAKRKTLAECDNECQLDRGQYVVVDIAPVRKNRKKAAK